MKNIFVQFIIILTTLLIAACSGNGSCATCSGNVSSQTVILDPSGGGISDGAVNVSLTPMIALKFTALMNPTTVNNSTVFLSTSPLTTTSATKDASIKKLQDTPGNSTAISSLTTSDNQIFSFSPLAPLQSTTKYYITVTSGAQTATGVPVVGEFTFTTGEFVKPMVSLINPQNNATAISLSPSIQLQFSEAVQNVNPTNVMLYSESASGSAVAIGAITAGANNSYVFSPTTALQEQTHYYIVLSSGINDLYGNTLESTVFSFSTGDFTVPTVSMTNPLNNATNVQLNSVINLQFSESVQNVTTTSLSLHSGSSSGPLVNYTLIATDLSQRSYSLQPLDNLNYATSYYVVAESSITDLAGNTLAPVVFNFSSEVFNLGNLALVSITNSIQLSGSLIATVELQNSSGVYTPLPITLNSNNANVGITIPSGCNLTTANNSCQVVLNGEYLGNSLITASTTSFAYSAVADFYTVSALGNGSYYDYAPMKINYPQSILNQCFIESNATITNACNNTVLDPIGSPGFIYSMTIFNPQARTSDAYVYIPFSIGFNQKSIYKCLLDSAGQVITPCSNAFPSGYFLIGNAFQSGFIPQVINGQAYLYFTAEDDIANGFVRRCNITSTGDLDNCVNTIGLNTYLPVNVSAISKMVMWNIESDKLSLYLASASYSGSIIRCGISVSTGLADEQCSVVLSNIGMVPQSLAFLNIGSQLYLYFGTFDSTSRNGVLKECAVDNNGDLGNCNTTNMALPLPTDDRNEIFSLTPVMQGTGLYLYATYFDLSGYGIPVTDTNLMSCLINSPTNLTCSNVHTYSDGGSPLGVFTFSFY